MSDSRIVKVEIVKQEVEEIRQLVKKIRTSVATTTIGKIVTGLLFKEFEDKKGWEKLGFKSKNECLNTGILGISRATFYDWKDEADAWYGKITDRQIEEIGMVKLKQMLPISKSPNIDKLIEIAPSCTIKEFQEHVETFARDNSIESRAFTLIKKVYYFTPEKWEVINRALQKYRRVCHIENERDYSETQALEFMAQEFENIPDESLM
jgi:hypothetical protein